jgi:tripartite-type tricarboxylate transporter receptor subunit TctC
MVEEHQTQRNMSAIMARPKSWRIIMHRFSIALAVLLAAGSTPSRAEYPDHTIQFVVPYTPGGTVDLLARALGQRLTAAWGQPVVILNRPGAGGSVGAEVVAKSPPDGYTIFLSTNSPLTTNLALYPSLGYDPIRDFEPIIVAGENSLVLAANPKLPVSNVKELIALAKQKPGELNAATSGNGSTAHLSLASFNKQAGVSIVHVPYRGGVPSLTAAIAGEVQLVFSDIVPAMPQIQDNRLKALGLTGLHRARIAPEIPTLDESGLPGFSITAWIGVVAPKGTPKAIVQKLNLEIGRALKDPEFANQMSKIGIDPLGNTPEEFAAFLRKEIPRWKQIVQDAEVKVQGAQ